MAFRPRPRIVPGQLRGRRRNRVERLAELLSGVPRAASEVAPSLRLLALYREIGWQVSVRRGEAVDEGGEPLPWISYPALAWLDSALGGTERVFEYGSGNSTAWFSRRVATVTTVEHDADWAARQREMGLANVDALHRPCGGDEDWAPGDDPYAGALDEYPAGTFDVVLVDGMARNSCAKAAVRHLPGAGVVILDNSDRPAHHPALDALREAGFGRIDFVGPNVIQGVFSATSAFSRQIPDGLAARRAYPTFWGF